MGERKPDLTLFSLRDFTDEAKRRDCTEIRLQDLTRTVPTRGAVKDEYRFRQYLVVLTAVDGPQTFGLRAVIEQAWAVEPTRDRDKHIANMGTALALLTRHLRSLGFTVRRGAYACDFAGMGDIELWTLDVDGKLVPSKGFVHLASGLAP